MSTPHIEHFVDERGNFIYRAEFEGSFLSKDEAKELGKYVSGILAENAKLRHDLEDANNQAEEVCIENAKLRELVRDMCVWAYIDSDCDLEDRFADRMAELGIEVG